MRKQHAYPLSSVLNRVQSFLRGHEKQSHEPIREQKSIFRAYIETPGNPVWSARNYEKFAQEGYMRNVIAHRAISMIAKSAASVDWRVFTKNAQERIHTRTHPLATLLNHPNPHCGGAELFEALYSHRYIHGNAFLHATGKNGVPQELYVLRPDRVQILPGSHGMVKAYRYTLGEKVVDYPVHPITGACRVLHMRNFHPLNDWYGLSPMEAAAYSIDQHNQAAIWNQALLQNGARPSGALMLKGRDDGMGGGMSDSQFNRLREQLDEQLSGANQAGRPLLLEGGLEWREMGMTNRDMDFMESKNSSARDTALAFGVPPNLLGIPGDNTYSNMQEARLALWEETIIPLLDNVKDALNTWLVPLFHADLEVDYDKDSISALSPRRESVWKRVGQAHFLTINEKRAQLGLSPIANGDRLAGNGEGHGI